VVAALNKTIQDREQTIKNHEQTIRDHKQTGRQLEKTIQESEVTSQAQQIVMQELKERRVDVFLHQALDGYRRDPNFFYNKGGIIYSHLTVQNSIETHMNICITIGHISEMFHKMRITSTFIGTSLYR
jgi:hypothetical protein